VAGVTRGINDIAALIAGAIWRRNDIVPAVITADLGLVNATPQVSVSVGGATRQAIYACPNAIQLKGCFVVGLSADRTSPLVVVASNYQVPLPAGGSGFGGGGFGESGYGE
jgi:hypothetical protein